MTQKFIVWAPFFDALKRTGLLDNPEMTRRVVIEAEVGRPCTISYELYAAEDAMNETIEAVVEAKTGQESQVK